MEEEIMYREVLLSIVQETRDKKGESAAYLVLGFSYYFLGQYDEAIKYMEMSLTIAKDIGDKNDEEAAYRSLGDCYSSLNQHDKAIKCLEMSLTIAKEIGDKNAESEAYRILGVSYYSLGQYKKAIECLEMSLTIAKEIGDKNGKEAAYRSLGNCYNSLYQHDRAIRCLEMSLIIAKETGNKNAESAAYRILGVSYYSLGQYKKAIECLEIGLTIAKGIGDKNGECAAYRILGNCYISLYQHDKAIKCLEMSLTIAKETGNKNAESTAYRLLGGFYYSLDQLDEAIKCLEMSLTIAKDIGDKNGEEAAYTCLGGFYNTLDQHDKAIKCLEMSLTIAKETGDKIAESGAYGLLGCSYYSIDKYDESIKCLEMSLTLAKEIGDKNGESAAYTNLTGSYYSRGQYDKAVKYLEMSLTIAKETGDRNLEAVAHVNLGHYYDTLHQFDKAIKNKKMSLTIAKEIGAKRDESAAYRGLGYSYLFFEKYDKAIKCLKMSLTIAKQIGNKNGESEANGILGSSYYSLGLYDKAIMHEEISLAISKETGDRNGEATSYTQLGRCYFCLEQYDKAIKYLEMSLIIAKKIESKAFEEGVYRDIGMFYSSVGQYEKAETNLKKSAECFEELFKNMPKNDDDKVSIIETFKYNYKVLIYILLVQQKRDEALIVAEKGRSRALAELMLTTNLPGYVLFSDPKCSDLHEILELVKSLGSTVVFFSSGFSFSTWVAQPNGNLLFQERYIEEPQYSKKTSIKKGVFPSEDSINVLVDKVLTLMKAPGRAVTCEDRSLSFLYPEEISKCTKKKPGSILCYRAMAVDFAFPKPVVPHLKRQFPAPKKEQEITRPTASVRRDQTEDPDKPKTPKESCLNSLLGRLYQILLEPVRQNVVGSQVIIVPDGKIALVPFSALVDENGHYVAESLQVRLIPSLATAKMIRDRPEEPPGQGRPLVIGDPDIGRVRRGKDTITAPRLPSAVKEVKLVGKVLGVKPLIGKNATKKRFLQRVERATIIHIAAHGDANMGEILLAPSSGTDINNLEDIMVKITDLEGKRIKAKLVVLSCCHSGRGEVKTEGVIGIARAFLGAGARAVLVTLWEVDDSATQLFMDHFYQNLSREISANKALNIAMNAVREDKYFHHPYFWAPFVLIGEDVTIFIRSK